MGPVSRKPQGAPYSYHLRSTTGRDVAQLVLDTVLLSDSSRVAAADDHGRALFCRLYGGI